MGVFGIAEVLTNIESVVSRTFVKTDTEPALPREEWKRSIGPIMRGSVLGFPLGLIAGGGAIIASFLSYGVEKRISKHPEEFGKGAIEGVAGPETANAAGGRLRTTAGAEIPIW